MGNAEIKLPFGINAAKRIVHINDVERGRACDCTCPGCKAPLTAAKGPVRQHHFRHAVEVECEGAAESAIHLAAKQLIRERRKLTLSQYVLRATRRDSKGRLHRDTEVVVPRETTRYFDSVAEECEVHGMRADLLAVEGNRPLMIEIRYMHAVDEQKRAKIQAANISAIEIDLSDVVDQVSDWESLWSLINDPARISWLYNTKEKEARAVLEKRLSALIATSEQEYDREVRARRERHAHERHRLREALQEMNSLSVPARLKQLSDEAEQHQIWQDHKRSLPFTWNELPDFLNVEVPNGDWIYGCDRRLWQIAFYSYFVCKRRTPFSVQRVDDWLQSTVGLKVPSCVNAVRAYGLKYPEMLSGTGEESVPCTWTTVNKFCQVLCTSGMLACSGPEREFPGQYFVSSGMPSKRPDRIHQLSRWSRRL